MYLEQKWYYLATGNNVIRKMSLCFMISYPVHVQLLWNSCRIPDHVWRHRLTWFHRTGRGLNVGNFHTTTELITRGPIIWRQRDLRHLLIWMNIGRRSDTFESACEARQVWTPSDMVRRQPFRLRRIPGGPEIPLGLVHVCQLNNSKKYHKVCHLSLLWLSSPRYLYILQTIWRRRPLIATIWLVYIT